LAATRKEAHPIGGARRSAPLPRVHSSHSATSPDTGSPPGWGRDAEGRVGACQATGARRCGALPPPKRRGATAVAPVSWPGAPPGSAVAARLPAQPLVVRLNDPQGLAGILRRRAYFVEEGPSIAGRAQGAEIRRPID